MPLNILIAEDNEFTSKQYKTALEKKGHHVTLTKNGEECVEIYNDETKYAELFKKDTPSPFDIVLLDQNMPRKTGTEAAKEILETKNNQRIIFLSAFGSPFTTFGFNCSRMRYLNLSISSNILCSSGVSWTFDRVQVWVNPQKSDMLLLSLSSHFTRSLVTVLMKDVFLLVL